MSLASTCILSQILVGKPIMCSRKLIRCHVANLTLEKLHSVGCICNLHDSKMKWHKENDSYTETVISLANLHTDSAQAKNISELKNVTQGIQRSLATEEKAKVVRFQVRLSNCKRQNFPIKSDQCFTTLSIFTFNNHIILSFWHWYYYNLQKQANFS